MIRTPDVMNWSCTHSTLPTSMTGLTPCSAAEEAIGSEGGPGDGYEVALALGNHPSLNEGEPFTQQVTFIDRGGMSWTATIDYGDDSGTETLQISEHGSFVLSHQYLDNGTYTITVELVNDDGQWDRQQLTATVWNEAPIIQTITAPLDPRSVSVTISAGATFTDAGILDTHLAGWNWGDGTTSAGSRVGEQRIGPGERHPRVRGARRLHRRTDGHR